MAQYGFHPVADIFPMMSDTDFATLRSDIQKNGLLEPIWLHPDGRIVDGRNRYKACIELGIEPKCRTWNGDGSLTAFVVSLNLHRRHLSAEQRAAVAVKMLPMLEVEAKGRQKESGGWKGNRYTGSLAVDQNFDQPLERAPQSAKIAAEATGTNHQYVSDAKRISETAPEVFDMMSDGKVNMPAAKQLADLDESKRQAVLNELQSVANGDKIGGREMRQALRTVHQRERKESPPLPSNKYRVWYADPPWQYNDSGVITDTDAYGRAERHYPTMSIEDLCAMGENIAHRCERDAVLFLWVTSPLLEDAFTVLRAWGFKYKSSFVWDKVRHNFAHYNSMRHEFLLVATRGSCTPDEKKLFDSVQSIERTDKHSEKPHEFREIIDTLYTWGNKIELFSRADVDGWDTWGNEPC